MKNVLLITVFLGACAHKVPARAPVAVVITPVEHAQLAVAGKKIEVSVPKGWKCIVSEEGSRLTLSDPSIPAIIEISPRAILDGSARATAEQLVGAFRHGFNGASKVGGDERSAYFNYAKLMKVGVTPEGEPWKLYHYGAVMIAEITATEGAMFQGQWPEKRHQEMMGILNGVLNTAKIER